jgi:glucokinase
LEKGMVTRKNSNKQHSLILAFDFGGTKLAAAIVDLKKGEINSYKRIRISADTTGPECLDQMLQMGKTILNESSYGLIDGIGVSFGGPVSPDGKSVLKSQHIIGWEKFPLVSSIEQEFKLPAVMENDANAAAIGEWFFGAGKKATPFVYVQLSTGIGSGIIIDGNIIKGQGLAGEIGHLTIEKNGPKCKCGNRGCLESFAAGWALDEEAQRLLGESASSKDLFTAYRLMNPDAQQIILDAMSSLALVVNNIICILDPSVIVFGGGMSKSNDVIRDILFPMVDAVAPPFLKNRTQLAFSDLDGKETLFGAALIADRVF